MEQRKKNRKSVVDSEEENQVENKPEILIEESAVEKKPTKTHKREKRDPKKIKKEAPKVEDIEKYCYDVIKDMRDLYNKDLELNASSNPAHFKIDNIEDICSKIIKKGTQEAFLKLGILKELKLWLEPLPDNSLPNQKIKRAILDLLIHLRVTKMDLLNSGVGKIVHFYSKNSREAMDIRKMSINIMKAWKSMIIREETEI